jgi:hypothetical protein
VTKLIKADGSATVDFPREEGETYLQWWQRGVGGLIEPVYMDGGDVILVNENGIAEGLPVNRRASIYARLNADVIYEYVLFGDALLVPQAEWDHE